jgi:hypothetical protein
MPVHRRTPPEAGANRDELVADLARELRNPTLIGQPIVLEDDTPETNSMRVHVIWDRWNDCPRDARSAIILDAYRNAMFSRELIDQITLALGVTVPEAIAMGLLPFQVVPSRRLGEQHSIEEYRQAMLTAGASALASAEHPQIRCATQEDAEKTIECLEQSLPNLKWIIVAQEIGSLSE